MRRLTLVTILTSLLLSAGCSSKQAIRETYRQADRSNALLQIKGPVEGTEPARLPADPAANRIRGQRCSIVFTDNLPQAQAEKLLGWLDAAMGDAADATGTSPLPHLHWRPTAVEDLPRSLSASLRVRNGQAIVPLPHQPTSNTATAIARDSLLGSYLPGVYHQLVQMRLSAPEGQRILRDHKVARPSGVLTFRRRYATGTRWYLAGVSNYAADTFCRSLASLSDAPRRTGFVADIPLKRLELLGDDLMSWSQFDKDDPGRHYAAATGLVLLILEQAGPDAIARINQRCEEHDELVDGRALRRIAADVVGRDPGQLASDFEFPNVGLALRWDGGRMVVRDMLGQSAAAGAGVKKGDTVLSIGGCDVAELPTWELGFYRAGWTRRQRVDMQIRRADDLLTATATPRTDTSWTIRDLPGGRDHP